MLVLVCGATTTVDRLAGHPCLGQLVTPASRNVVRGDMPWAADNGCFNGLDERAFRSMVDSLPQGGLFVVVPDVLGHHWATVEQWRRWRPVVETAGHPPAFVLQDGCGWFPADAAAVFVGGSTEFKLGRDAAALVRRARGSGLWAHMGRVNSRRRMRYAASIGCQSVDGTAVSMFPEIKLPKMLAWAAEPVQETLFLGD